MTAQEVRLSEIITEVEKEVGDPETYGPRAFAREVAMRFAQHLDEGSESGAFVEFDDGEKVFVDRWTGSAHATGSFGQITLRLVAADGTAKVREYQALDVPKAGRPEAAQALRVILDVKAILMDHRIDHLAIRLNDAMRRIDAFENGAQVPVSPHDRVQTLLNDLGDEGLKLRVWLEPLLPLAMGHHVMHYELRPANYPRVETHAEGDKK